ncbi:hypothetical protein VTI74DRAFT_3716 [Chaetomium olivicolor]
MLRSGAGWWRDGHPGTAIYKRWGSKRSPQQFYCSSWTGFFGQNHSKTDHATKPQTAGEPTAHNPEWPGTLYPELTTVSCYVPESSRVSSQDSSEIIHTQAIPPWLHAMPKSHVPKLQRSYTRIQRDNLCPIAIPNSYLPVLGILYTPPSRL